MSITVGSRRRDEIERLEIEVEQRCHSQAELAEPIAADEVTLAVSDTGRTLVLFLEGEEVGGTPVSPAPPCKGRGF